jgi:diaminopimelate decarboxylase
MIRAAADSGVEMMTFDNADELYKVKRAHPNAKSRASLERCAVFESESTEGFGIVGEDTEDEFGVGMSTLDLVASVDSDSNTAHRSRLARDSSRSPSSLAST